MSSVSTLDYPTDSVAQLPLVYGGGGCQGLLRVEPEDFKVVEIPLVEPDGSGEHCLLEIEKRNCNTEWVARLLSRHASVSPNDVGYAGRKDRNALTRQWFSVRLAGRAAPDWHLLESSELRIIRVERHSRKLRTGALRGNRFAIRVRQFRGETGMLSQTLAALGSSGMPNYFGEQRFGHDEANLQEARAMFEGTRVKRHKKGIYLSAARSMLFNRVLARRVRDGTWNKPLSGEQFILDGSRNSFTVEEPDETIDHRLHGMDIHPSGPLWGRGRSEPEGESALLELEALRGMKAWQAGLERFGLKLERRALRAPVRDLDWTLEGDDLQLEFSLGKGSYATVMLRELIGTSHIRGVRPLSQPTRDR
ncbi:MAG: tRNA pseudouridine(13) synthase TruD [Gammaproteobacteria bacterium]|nr:tRNA pseudouridine(13) synthase TruD [Gammaproteobacteria bacterium]